MTFWPPGISKKAPGILENSTDSGGASVILKTIQNCIILKIFFFEFFEFNLGGAKDYTDFQFANFAMVVPDFQCCELEIGLNCELILGVQNPDSG